MYGPDLDAHPDAVEKYAWADREVLRGPVRCDPTRHDDGDGSGRRSEARPAVHVEADVSVVAATAPLVDVSFDYQNSLSASLQLANTDVTVNLAVLVPYLDTSANVTARLLISDGEFTVRQPWLSIQGSI